MTNPINQAIEEIGKSVHQMREANDKRLEELEKGDKTRAAELEVVTDKWNKQVDVISSQLKEIKQGQEMQAAQVEMLEALAERPKGTPAEQAEAKHADLWTKWLRSGMKDSQLEGEVKAAAAKVAELKSESKTVLSGTALAGGNGVPEIVSTTIEKLVLAQSDILPEVNTVMTGSPDYNELVTIAGANGGWSAEAGSRSQSTEPNLRKVTITHGELYAFPRASNWSLNDIWFDVLGWLTQDAADTMAVSVATAIHAGDGSSKPTGMTNSAPTNADDYASPMRAAAVYEYIATGSSPVTTAPTMDDLIDLQVALRRQYQMNAKWTMNSTTMGQLRKLKDGNNNYIWQPSTQQGTPDLLLGKPVFIWEDMADYGANALPVAYGDFRRAYTYATIGGMTMIRDEVTVPGFTNFLLAQRAGGIPRNNNAVKFLKMVAS